MGILAMQIEQEALLAPGDIIFLDRALPDALAYYHFLNLPVEQSLMAAINLYRYKKVFILDILPMVQDYARREDDNAQRKIHELLINVYTSLNFPVIHVPILPPDQRVDFILNNL